MTRADAIKAIGKPKSTTADRRGEVLTYEFTDKPFGDGMIFPGRYYVVVQDGRVAGWQRDEQKDALDRQRAFEMNTMGLGGGIAAPSVGAPPGTGSGVIETRMDGDFEGWTGETIFKLANGQIWQQTEFAYTYHYAYRPKVLIYRSKTGGWKLQVEGVNRAIGVQRLK